MILSTERHGAISAMTDRPKEHGLLFKPDMIRAYLAGRKTMSRRVITRQNSYIDGGPAYKRIWDGLQFDKAWVDQGPSPAGNIGPYLQVPRIETKNGKFVDKYVHRIYPRYQVGDTIWGRESWALPPQYDPKRHGDLKTEPLIGPVCYAEQYMGSSHLPSPVPWEGAKWRPSIHMPRWAARIVMPIVASRPEQLDRISAEDCLAEGIEPVEESEYETGDQGQAIAEYKVFSEDGTVDVFRDLWDDINQKRGCGWHDDSWHGWVWALTFERYGEEV